MLNILRYTNENSVAAWSVAYGLCVHSDLSRLSIYVGPLLHHHASSRIIMRTMDGLKYCFRLRFTSCFIFFRLFSNILVVLHIFSIL